ncbi:MAG: Rv0909 family putative TA system antitoxin [Terracoccus sp.]
MSDWINKAKDFVTGHPEQAKDGLGKAADFINDKTGGKYADQVGQGSEKLGEALGLPADDPAETPVEAPDPSTEVPVEPAPEQPDVAPAPEQDLPGVANPDLPGQSAPGPTQP